MAKNENIQGSEDAFERSLVRKQNELTDPEPSHSLKSISLSTPVRI
jgi:hypothetical protein